MVKSVKSSHLLHELFDKLCVKQFNKTYVLILFTTTRLTTVFYAAQHLVGLRRRVPLYHVRL